MRFLPTRLGAVSTAWLTWLRPVWFLLLALAVVLDIAGTVFVLRDVYRNDPQFTRLGVVSIIENDGSVTIEPIGGVEGAPAVEPGSRIVAIDGKPVPPDTPVWDVAKRLAAKNGQVVALSVAAPGGKVATHQIAATDRFTAVRDERLPLGRDAQMAARMFVSLLTCATLILCAVLLFLRRSQDAVALLFSVAFLIFAGSIDPPLTMWMAAGMGDAYDVFSTIGWALLVVGLAVFPDGRFNPRPVRFVLLAAPLAMVPLAIDDFPLEIATIIAFVLPLFLLVCHVIKYRRFEPGIERQQIKWAAFGFATGLLLLTGAFLFFSYLERTGTTVPLSGLIIVSMLSLGFMAMALGLLVSLLRFRLWEADRVISRSAISAAVTLAVGVIWTLSMDMLKVGVEWVLGEENEAVATMAGAILAAGIFAPTQALAMRWAKRRLAGDESRIRRLIDRLAVWRTTETPEEIGVRTLSALQAAVHCSAGALLVDGPRGLRLLAARDLDRPEELNLPSHDPAKDARFAMVLPLEDEDGPIGQLLVGPRSDFNRYNAAQLDGLKELTEPLAEALRTSLKRSQLVEGLHSKLGTVEERLARLESGGPRLSPT
jgi:hypothetical protein